MAAKTHEVIEPAQQYLWRSSAPINTVTDAARSFLSQCQAQKKSPNTIRAYRNGLNRIGDLLAELTGHPANELPLSVLNADDLTDAFNRYSADHAPDSTRQTWTVWNRLCERLTDRELLPRNPMKRVAVPKRRGYSVPKGLPTHAVEALLSYLANPPSDSNKHRGRNSWHERDHALILLALATGMRESELVGINMADMQAPYGSQDARTVAVRGKGDKERVLTIEAPVVNVISDYLTSRAELLPDTVRKDNGLWECFGSDAALFVNTDGTRLTARQAYSRVSIAYSRAGINAYRVEGALVHQLRHTAATGLADNPNVTVFQLKHILGHSTLSATQRYTEGAGRNTREAARHNPVYQMLDK